MPWAILKPTKRPAMILRTITNGFSFSRPTESPNLKHITLEFHMKNLLGVFLLAGLCGCEVRGQIDKQQAASRAEAALAMWIQENPLDAYQIEGASVTEISWEANLIHVVLENDASETDEQGRLHPDGMHIAYFHVYLTADYRVVRGVRGPDIVE